jgi:uncharacterized protein (DUF305 family)
VSTGKPFRRTAFTALCAGAALLLSGCGPETGAAPVVSAPADSVPASGFNSTDLAWLQLMVPMTENVVEVLRLARDHSASLTLTTEIAVGQNANLLRLRALRDRAGLPTSSVHEGHRMPGMVTEADLVVLRDTHGADFDRRATALLGAHLDQAVLLCQGERQSGQDGETRALAAEIVKSTGARPAPDRR